MRAGRMRNREFLKAILVCMERGGGESGEVKK